MNPRGLKALLALASVLAGMAGCGRKSSATGDLDPSSPPTAVTTGRKWPSSNAVPADRLEWNHRTLVDAYNEVGERNPLWDQSARDALNAFAQVRCGTDTNAAGRLKSSLERAREAGCADPLIRYLNLRFAHGDASDANANGADEYPSCFGKCTECSPTTKPLD